MIFSEVTFQNVKTIKGEEGRGGERVNSQLGEWRDVENLVLEEDKKVTTRQAYR